MGEDEVAVVNEVCGVNATTLGVDASSAIIALQEAACATAPRPTRLVGYPKTLAPQPVVYAYPLDDWGRLLVTLTKDARSNNVTEISLVSENHRQFLGERDAKELYAILKKHFGGEEHGR